MVWSVYKLNPKAREFYEHLGAKLFDGFDYMYMEWRIRIRPKLSAEYTRSGDRG